MAVAGLRGTGDWATDERPKNFREAILWREPNGSAPLTALLSKIRSEAVDDPEFNWWEEENSPVRLQVNGDVAQAGTTITVDFGDAQDLAPGDLLLVLKAFAESASVYSYDNELIEVSSITSSTVFVVTRAAAGTSAPAGADSIPDDAFLLRVGNVFEEGSTSPDATSKNPSKDYNLCQIFKTSFNLTETAKKTKTRTGDALNNDKKRRMFVHSTLLEQSFLFGKRYETTGPNGKPKRYTGGLLYFLAADDATNTDTVKVWTAAPTVDAFLDAVYKMWNYTTGVGGNNERIVFAGNQFLNKLNKMARGDTNTRVNFDGTVKVYGMELQRWILPQGTLFVRTHPLMNVIPEFEDAAFMINPAALVYRYLRDTKSQNNIQANDADQEKGQWLSEVGLEVHHLKTMQFHANFNQ